MRHALLAFLRYCLWTAALLLTGAACLQAQSADPDIQRLKEQKDRAQLEADIAKAEKEKAEAEAAAFKARLGSLSTANLPQGKVTAENVVIEGNYLAYMAANSAARVIAGKISCKANIVFFSAKDLDAIQALNALRAQIPLISSGKSELVTPLSLVRVSAFVLPDPAGNELQKLYTFSGDVKFSAAPIFAGIDAGLSLLPLFKTDTEFHGVTVKADDLALQALVAKQWKELCGPTPSKVIHPDYSYPTIKADPIKELKDFSTSLSEVNLIYVNLVERVQTPLGKAVEGLRKLMADHRDTLQLIAALEGKLAAATTPKEEKKPIKEKLDSTKKHLAELTETVRARYDIAEKLPPPEKPPYSDENLADILNAYLTDQLLTDIRIQALKAMQTKMSEFVAALTKTDSNGVTPLVAMLRAQALETAKGREANLLQVGFVTAGGNNIIKKNIFHSSLRFSGGVISKYLLVDKDGYLVQSGVVACYGGQLKEGDIAKTFSAQRGAMACTEDIPK